jgi:endonuclease/exonuclease/phosphatase family metal-dependent hydrolase
LALGTVSPPAQALNPLPARSFAHASVSAPQLIVAAAKKLKHAAPTGLRAKASARGADVVALNWWFKTPGLHYQVQYATTPNFVGGKAIIVKVASTAIGGLPTGLLHYFRVRIVNSANKATSGWSRAVTAVPQPPSDPGASPLQVASFNIRNWKRTGSGGKWSLRGPLVAATILSRKSDVVGLQEADFNTVGGINQIDSLLRMLNAKGAAYRAVDSGAGPTAGTRIIYNSATVTPVQTGMRQLSTLAGDVKRYVVWAKFVQSATGRQFLFATTHLVSNPKSVKTKKCSGSQTKYYKMRKVQAGQVVDEIRGQAGGLPVVLTGDMNSHKVHCPNNAPYRVYAAAGLVDPLGNPDFSKTPVSPTTEVRIHSEWDTSNHYARKPVRHNTINGHHVDYVWVSKSIRTLEYEVVVKINDSTLKYVGTHPSDHNMVRASILIP